VGKQSRTPERLQAMAQVRLNAVLSREASADSLALRAGMPRPHPRDMLGRNWDIDDLHNGRGHVTGAFRAIVDELRLEYDLVTPDHL
jgi:hypothetical protein